MNEKIMEASDLFEGALWSAGERLSGAHSLGDLRVRVHALFRRMDQETVEYTGTRDLDRFRRGQVVECLQEGLPEGAGAWISS